MKVIFLDIDGVLNCDSTKEVAFGSLGIDDGKVELLAQIIKATNARIVLISTWKYAWHPQEIKCDLRGVYINEKFRKYGIMVEDKTYDKRGGIFMGRGEGILDYLSLYTVERYVILDDGQFDYDSCGLTERWVQTNPATGLTPENAAQAISMLNEK